MLSHRHFLLIEVAPLGESLLSHTLARTFPQAKIHYSAEAAEGIEIARVEKLSAVIVHRAIGMTSEEAVRTLRQVIPKVPIVMVSVNNRRESALAAGATQFLLYDEWLMLGQVVSSLLKGGSGTPWPTS